ncbi:hypothetical protein B2I21_31860 [Chryseobacterium mucoviscidosis]|nr:hypothetical protein B2I21_31860 [Chryseobacterium mucoviscidosis]
MEEGLNHDEWFEIIIALETRIADFESRISDIYSIANGRVPSDLEQSIIDACRERIVHLRTAMDKVSAAGWL